MVNHSFNSTLVSAESVEKKYYSTYQKLLIVWLCWIFLHYNSGPKFLFPSSKFKSQFIILCSFQTHMPVHNVWMCVMLQWCGLFVCSIRAVCVARLFEGNDQNCHLGLPTVKALQYPPIYVKLLSNQAIRNHVLSAWNKLQMILWETAALLRLSVLPPANTALRWDFLKWEEA